MVLKTRIYSDPDAVMMVLTLGRPLLSLESLARMQLQPHLGSAELESYKSRFQMEKVKLHVFSPPVTPSSTSRSSGPVSGSHWPGVRGCCHEIGEKCH